MSIWLLSASQLRDRVAEGNPTPGAGTVSYVCAVLAGNLLVKALEITKNKAPAANVGAHSERQEALRHHSAALTQAADEDIAAFDAFLAALALPKSTNEELALRRNARSRAAFGAATVPIGAAEHILACLDLAVAAAKIVRIQMLDDVLASIDLLHGAGMAALRNVDANLPAVANQAESSRLAKRRAELGRAIGQAAADAYAAAAARTAAANAT